MRSGKQICDSPQGEEYGAKTDDGHNGYSPAPPAHGKTQMQQGSVQKPGNERPGFLGIPMPV